MNKGWKVTALSCSGQTARVWGKDLPEAAVNPLRTGQCCVCVEWPLVTVHGNLSLGHKIEVRPFLGSSEEAGRVMMLVPKRQLRLQRN